MRLRALSLGAGLVLAGATLVAVPSPAQAAAVSAASISASRFVSEVGPANCNVTNPSSNTPATFTSDGATVTKVASGVAFLQDQVDSGDTVSVNHTVTTKVRSTEAAGKLRTVAIDLGVDVTVTAAQGLGTDCDIQASSVAQWQYTTVQSSGQWVTFDGRLPVNTSLTAVFSRSTPATPAVNATVFLLGTAKGRVTSEVFLPAGTYTVGGTLSNQYASPVAAGEPSSLEIDASIDITYADPGTAIDKAAGDGASYAKLKDARDCAKGELRGKFLKAAGTKGKPALKKAVFKVNGAKSLVVKKAVKNGKIKLKNLPADQDVSVKAVFKKVGGGSESFTRTYRSCT